MAHVWSEWNREYFDSSSLIPRLMVRLEDILFHPKQVIDQISLCTGIERVLPHRYNTHAAKNHGKSADFLHAIAKYGSNKGRYGGMSRRDFEFAKNALDPVLMKAFRYVHGPGPDAAIS